MHLLRGSGVEGLAGMRPLRDNIARPLLNLYRPETEGYCAAKGWQPRHDLSNDDLAFTRNRIRNELVPILSRYNPHLMSTLSNNAALIASDDDYLETATTAEWRDIPVEVSAERVTVALAPLRDMPLALRHRGLRRIVERLTSGESVPEARHLLSLDALFDRRIAGLSLDIPGNVRVTISYDVLHVVRLAKVRPTTRQSPRVNYPLHVPGEVALPDLGWKVQAWFTDRPAGLEAPEPAPPPSRMPFPHSGTRADLGRAELRAYLDGDLAGSPHVRTWQPGDRFQPLGMLNSKKLQDYFADAKVPRELRSQDTARRWTHLHILWIGGQRIDETRTGLL